MGNPIIIEPSIKQVRSGKIRKPTKVHVTTTLMEFQADDESITIQTVWEIDYELREIQYIAGLLIAITLAESLLPWRVPNRHLRAARRVAAVAFGMERFRRPVRMYERFEKDHLFVASTKGSRILLVDKEDAIIWGHKFRVQPKVEKLPVNTAAKLFNMTKQATIETAQRMSMLQKSRFYLLMQRSISGNSASRAFEEIKKRGFPEPLSTKFANYMIDMEYMIKKENKLRN